LSRLALPLGVAARVLGASAGAVRGVRQAQIDLHALAQTAGELPRVEAELTRRMDDAEQTLERAIVGVEALVAAMPLIVAGVDELRAARKAAQALADSLPLLGRAADAGERLAAGLDEVRDSRAVLETATGQIERLIATAERTQATLERASHNVELALERAEPLQGLTERLGRLSERLPGGRER
jgi:chromosome segregation ATPase